MRRLYFRIYLAVLGSLVLFAALAAMGWWLFADFDRFGPHPEFYAEVAERLLPPAGVPAAAQQAALIHWRNASGYDLALFAADGSSIADASDGALFPPDEAEDGPFPGSGPWRGPYGAHAVRLRDGRWLVAAPPFRGHGRPWRLGWLAGLMAIGLAVAVCAYPVVRRLTRDLERLQRSVEALGSGDLSARVAMRGDDEVARLAATFNRAAARIEALVSAHKSLLANASHELRSPLARLRMGVEALGPGAPDALRAEIARNVAELDQLIDEILLASRLDAQGGDANRFEAVDIVALAAEECARIGATLDAAAAAGIILPGDVRLLRRLLRNLLENARRHGGGSPIEVTIGARGHQTVVIDVCDRGPGVADSERERIFEPFFRPAGVREREGGVGLGLALVRQIAERHGGTVICLPREGGGSCFRVMLPRGVEGDAGHEP